MRSAIKLLILIQAFFSLSLFGCQDDTEIAEEKVDQTSTTVILVRHAEVSGIGSNPNLSNAGIDRANSLVDVLKNTPLEAVYSTNYNRTMQTATPIAADRSLNILTYNPSALLEFSDTIKQKHLGKVVLVVGHSNTTPELLNILLDSIQFGNIPEKEYDNMYRVSIKQDGKAEVHHQKY